MKILLLIAIVLAAFIVPDDSVSVHVNVKPSKTNAKPTRRDTLPDVKMKITAFNIVEEPPRLTYNFQVIKNAVVVQNIDWLKAFDYKKGKYIARINRVDQDDHVLQTLYAGQLNCELMQLYILNYGIYKIAVFQEGNYCNGIEYDFRYFGRDNMTPISEFSHHSILCQ